MEPEEPSTDQGLVHVVFPLEVDASGWPPVSVERVWAEPLGGDRYRIDNAPWFATGVAAGDVVRAVPPEPGSWPVFVESIEWSGNCTIRVIPLEGGALAGDLRAVLDAFAPFGVTGEGAGRWPIVSLTVPAEADIAAVKRLLDEGERVGTWSYEEGCVGEDWQDRPP